MKLIVESCVDVGGAARRVTSVVDVVIPRVRRRNFRFPLYSSNVDTTSCTEEDGSGCGDRRLPSFALAGVQTYVR